MSTRIAKARPLPSIECNSIAIGKRGVANSDAITGTILYCISSELESGRFVLLSQEPWVRLQYGVTSLKGVPRTQVAERFLEFVLDAEREASLEEHRLITRFDSDRTRRSRTRKA